jgi:hypothetical protein
VNVRFSILSVTPHIPLQCLVSPFTESTGQHIEWLAMVQIPLNDYEAMDL